MIVYLNAKSKEFADKRRKEEKIGQTLDFITIMACVIAAIVATSFVTTIL